MEQRTEVVVAGESTAAAESVADPRTGEIRVLSDRCTTCVLNPAEFRIPLSQASQARLRAFLAEAREAGGHVVCHRTLSVCAPPGVKPAMCRGFIDAYGLPDAVRLALELGLGHLVEQDDYPS